MKELLFINIIACLTIIGLSGCNNSKTYAEMKEDEADAINEWIVKHDYKVISEDDFYKDTMTHANEFVLFKDNGIYLNIVNRGKGAGRLGNGAYIMLSRYTEVALQQRDDMFQIGDTLTGNTNLKNYPVYRISNWQLANYMTYPDEYRLTVEGNSYQASFQGTSVMASVYQSRNVPNGWLFPLQFLKPSRSQSPEEWAHVRLILPHAEGTVQASQYVYPCFYDITYNMGR